MVLRDGTWRLRRVEIDEALERLDKALLELVGKESL